MDSDQEFEEALESYLRDSAEVKDPAEKNLREKLDQAMIAWLEGGKAGLEKFLLELERQENDKDISDTPENTLQEPKPPDLLDNK